MSNVKYQLSNVKYPFSHIRENIAIIGRSCMRKEKKLRVSIGIAAFNEEKNITQLLKSIINQKIEHVFISEILIISSGSTDKTNSIIKKFITDKKNKENLVRKIQLITQKKRLGKASAVNVILSKAREDIIILSSADLIWENRMLEKLVTPLANEKIGIVGAHPIPLNEENTFFGFAALLQWNLHHWISLKAPKMGECIAFRKIFKRIHVLSAVDEVNIELLIKGQGYSLFYEPQAIVYNMGPETLHEFLSRRRHIYAGHIAAAREYGYKVSTISSKRIFFALIKNIKLSWHFLIWTPAIIFLEGYSRFLGTLDYYFGFKKHTIWEITKSTKKLPVKKLTSY